MIATVQRLVEFYVTEHNERIPHGALEGQTPNEMYFGRGAQVPDDLTLRRREPAAYGAQPRSGLRGVPPGSPVSSGDIAA